MLFPRTIASRLKKAILSGPDRGIILYGPRQAGKTTLLKHMLTTIDPPALWFTGDDVRTQELFGEPRLDRLSEAVGNTKLVVIDEAQRIPHIGLSAKLLIDELRMRVVLSGSSSFDLANKVSEPLTGRITTMFLYPLSLAELPKDELTKSSEALEGLLRYGMYPAVHARRGQLQKEQYLSDLINTYLYKDMLMIEGVRKPKKLLDLLSLLALQVGSEVSIAELCRRLGLSRPVIEKYLDILEKMFVVVNVRGLSRNVRKEIYKTSKYYFFDIGLRNALIRNMNPLAIRSDTGALFENFCAMERVKLHANSRRPTNYYFWRTWDQKELDWVEERGGKLNAYEWKWSDTRRISRAMRDVFLTAYPGSTISSVTRESYHMLAKM